MTAASNRPWLTSGKARPCPVCGRDKDGDCRIHTEGNRVICHHSRGFRPGIVQNGWALTGPTSDGRGDHWVIDEPKDNRSKVVQLRPAATPQQKPPATAPITGPIVLAKLPEPAAEPPSRGVEVVFRYSATQQSRRRTGPDGLKICKPWHHNGREWVCAEGHDPWPLYWETEALAADGWILELEGEPCADWARAGGMVAITQPGHKHTPEAIGPRYARLVDAGVRGVVYVSDNDGEGIKRANQASTAAAAVGLPFLHLPAVKVWPDLPTKGSIDDALGTPSQRVAAIEQALPQALADLQNAEHNPGPDELEAAANNDLDLIRNAADIVVSENENLNRPQYLHKLRELIESSLSVPARDELYRREIGDAIIRRDGIESRPFVGGCELPDDAEEWIIDCLILAGVLNIIGADPKAGKTLWCVALIASLIHGYQQFIGRNIANRPPSVIIVGPDQPVRLWKKQLKAVGLVKGNTLDPRIVRLWDSQNPWAATTEGITELRQVCADHPGSLVLIDSFAKVSEKLGIDENSREAAEVLSDIERACITSHCTPLVIHHNGKAAGRTGIVNGGALRGSGSIRANASQVAILTLVDQDNPKDRRRRLVTEGRGGESLDAVIQLEEDGWGWRHVCDFAEHRGAAAAQRTRDKLTPGQETALEAVEASEEPLTTAQVWAVINPEKPWDKESSDAKGLSRTLAKLASKHLLHRSEGVANRPTYARRDG